MILESCPHKKLVLEPYYNVNYLSNRICYIILVDLKPCKWCMKNLNAAMMLSKSNTGVIRTYDIIFKKGSKIWRKCCSGHDLKKLTNFWTASFLNIACSTFLLSLSCVRHIAIESNAVTDQISSSSRLRYTSNPPWALNSSLELRDACAISQSRGNAYCFKGEPVMTKCIKCGIIPFSAACSCLLLFILQRLNNALRTFNK